MLPKRSISLVQLCLLLILIPSSFSQYYNPSDYSESDDDHAGYRESSSSNDDAEEEAVDERPDYSRYYQKDATAPAALTAGAFDAEGAKESDHGFVTPIDFSGFLSAGQFGAASNQASAHPVIPLNNPFKFQDALKQQNSSGFVDASEFTANFANAPSFDSEISKHFANNPFEQKTENTYVAPKKDYTKQDDLSRYNKGDKNYEKPKIDYTNLDYKNYNPVLPTISSYTGGKLNHLAPVKTYVPKLYPSTKHTNAPLNIQSTLAPYNFQSLESLKSTQLPLNSYNVPSTAFAPTEYAQPSEYQSEKVQSNCKKIEKQLSPDDITHGRFRRQADKMNCFLCTDPKTGGSYEQCSYTSDPENDKSYFTGHASKYRTKTYSDPDEHSRRRRETKSKRRNKQKRQQETVDDYSNPFEDQKKHSHNFDSKPEAFDDAEYKAPDFSHYEKDSENYEFGPEYFQDSTNNEKSYSELQSEELKKNGQNCKKVKKDSMTCMICSNPKTGGNYEQCSYTSEPNEKKYAYVKEKKYNSNDPQPEEKVIVESTETKPNKEKYTEPSIKPFEFTSASVKHSKKVSDDKNDYDYIPPHYISESKQNKRFDQPDNNKDYLYKLFPEYAEKESQNREVKQRPYKSELPSDYFTAEESKKDVDSVLQDFAKKDRSQCKKIAKDKMTCYICVDKKGIQHEECMFVSESAPKSSHVAYHEVKEFSSDPNKNKEEVTADSKPNPVITKRQNSKLPLTEVDAEPAEFVKIIGRQADESRIQGVKIRRKREKKTKSEKKSKSEPEPAAPEVPKDAYASELVPTFSKQWGVTLPKYMLDISEGEKEFDEVVRRG